MNILCIGDIVGRPGRSVLLKHLDAIKSQYAIDFTIANIENAASGFGVTLPIYNELLGIGIDAFSSGNHIYDKRELLPKFHQLEQLVRPLNFAKGSPGEGIRLFHCGDIRIALVNLIGRVFMSLSDCPFSAIAAQLPLLAEQADVIVVDFHAETTSEKQAMGWFLDGKASIVFGTHTHVMTADERVLPGGTAYITDIGMTGAANGILGMERDPIIKKFFNQLPVKFEPSKSKGWMMNAICVSIDEKSRLATKIQRIHFIDYEH